MTERHTAGAPLIVVGVDGSAPSREALVWAVGYAALVGARVEAVTSWSYPSMYGISGGLSDWDPEADAQKVLAEVVDSALGANAPSSLKQLVREGNAARVLLDESKDAQLLVVGSRGHGGFAGLLLGSVSANCAEHAQCPVVVIHGKA